MNIIHVTRRAFLKTGCILGGAALIGIRITGKAVAAGKQVKDYMVDRIDSVYGADAKFPARASQDNVQVQTLYKKFLHEPGGHVSHQYLHMHFTDRSKNIAKLKAEGKFPNPRAKEFEGNKYPYE